jgi:ABC-type multidrug transport system ATPase subunit
VQIELRDVHKRFGAVSVLRGIDLSVPVGRRLALIGPNGSGKSTLIRVIMGILSCDGEVRLDGLDPTSKRPELLRRMAYVPQIAPQLVAPVAEVLRAICELRELLPERVIEVAGKLGLDLGLPAIRLRPFRNLSGGMKQKLLIALALAVSPSLLVLDEPTASLDAGSRARFFQLFAALPKETTVVLCSHRLEEVQNLVDHVVSMEEGRIVHETPEKGVRLYA